MVAVRICGPCQRGQHGACDGPNEYWGFCTCIHHSGLTLPVEED